MRNPPSQRPTKRNLEVDVSDVAFGGDGIARVDGKVIFIEQAVPGERVEVALLQDKKRFAKGRVVRKLSPAPDAVPAPCPVFGRCGGCDWQHVPYPKQLEWKASFIRSALQKNARYEHPEPIAVRPSSQEYSYRNRIKLKARIAPSRRFEFGYHAQGSHQVVPIAQCPIADRAINALLDELRDLVMPGREAWQGECELQRLEGDRRLLHFMPPLPREVHKALAAALPRDAIAAPSGSAFEEFERESGLIYATQAGQFQQVNRAANHAMRAWVRRKVEETGSQTVLDLFCGSGNLSLQLLNGRRQVWGLELAEPAIETAQQNLKINGLSGGIYKSGPVSELARLFPDLPRGLDCVITDPPRQGMDDSLNELLALRPRHILSISCDPNTFARDLQGMLEAGYEVRELFGYDFFPHTYHVETIAHLVRA